MKTTNLPVYNIAVSAETSPRQFVPYAGTTALSYEDALYIAEAANDHSKLVEALRDAWKGDLSIERYAQIGALLERYK